MVVVVVREDDPAHVGRLDERGDLLEPGVADEERAGVDQRRLGAADHEAVHPDEGAGRLGGEGRDEPGVVGDRVRSGREDLGIVMARPLSLVWTRID